MLDSQSFLNLSSEGIYKIEFPSEIDVTVEEEKLVESFLNYGTIAECNGAMLKLFHYSNVNDVKGEKINLFWPGSETNNKSLKKFIKSGFKVENQETVIVDKSGMPRYFLNNLLGIVEDRKLKKVWVTVREITEVKNSLNALLQINEDYVRTVQQLELYQNEFEGKFYKIVHDLNSPLSNIEGLINILKLNDCYKNEETNGLLDMMCSALAKFKATIKDIAKAPVSLNNGKEKSTFKTSISEIVDNVSLNYRSQIDNGLLVIDTNFDVPEVKLTPESVRTILKALLTQAVKNRKDTDQTIVQLSTHTEGPYLVFTVKDNSKGFLPEHQSHVFDMLNSTNGFDEETAMGLYLVKRIAEQAGGKAELSSADGKGSVFKIYFRNE